MYLDPNKFQAIILVTLVLSYAYCLAIIFVFKTLNVQDKFLKNTQSSHSVSTPRLGGLALLASIISVEIIFGGIFRLWFFWSLFPIFLVGLMEDFHFETPPFLRLLIGTFSSLIAIYLSNSWINSVDLLFFDKILAISFFGIVFTIFASVGMINAINLIDGVNGLAAANSVLISIGIFLIASKVGENGIAAMGVLVAASSLGLFFASFPYGRIFMGDSGAYTLGFIIAWQMIILLNRNPEISAWSLLAVSFWPVMDTLFAIFRRKIKGKSSNKPDLMHFHQLVMRFWELISNKRLKRSFSNPMATATILPFTFFPIIFGIKYCFNVNAGIIIVITSLFLYISTYYLFLLILKKRQLRNLICKITEPLWFRIC